MRWPGGGSATVQTGRRVRAGTSPISVSSPAHGAAPAKVTVTTVDQKTADAAGVHGVMFTLRGSGSAGAVGVDVDSTTFRNAFGGDYASRLRLVRLPSCVLTTPADPRCQVETPLSASLSAQVTVAATESVVLAADSTAGGPAGDYSATSLSPGGTWSVSGNTGAFTYSYPISVPPATGGASPSISLAYDSATQDARTEGTNNQSSWLGDGWSSTENYVERTYKPCSDITGSGAPEYDGDQCWDGQILTLSLNGSSTPIVYDDATQTFRPADDSSTTKIEDVSGGTTNGTANGEYFRVTENGVKYYFGLNRLPGWASGNPETKSAWTMPVYNAHAGIELRPTANTSLSLGFGYQQNSGAVGSENALPPGANPFTQGVRR